MKLEKLVAIAAIALIILLRVVPTSTEPSTEMKLSKLESVFYRLLPDGTLSDGEAEVTIRVENPSDEEKAITVVDRIAEAHLESFSVLSGSPEPSTKDVFFDHIVCVWRDIVVPPSSDVELRYSVSTFKPPPISVNITYYVNGEKISPVELEGDYYIMINSGDVLTINLTVENLRDPMYIDGEMLKPPLPYSIEVRIPKNNFLEPESYPEPYMVYSLSEDWSVTWIGVMEEEPLNISLSAKARTTEFTGEVELKAVRIQLQLDASSIADQLEEVLKSYNASLSELENMEESLSNMHRLMTEFSKGISSSSKNLEEAQFQLMELSKALRNASQSVESARTPIKSVILVLNSLESNLTKMMDVIEEIQRNIGQPPNTTIPNLTIPIPPFDFSLEEELANILSRVRSTKSSLYAADKAFETMQASFSEAADYAYNSSLVLGELQQSLRSVGIITNASIRLIEASLDDIGSRISKINSEMEDLSRRIKVARFRESFLGDVEIRTGNSSCTDTELKAEITKISEGKWAISSIILEGPSMNASEIALQILCEIGGIVKTPPKEAVITQIYDDDSWIDIESTALGVSYDEELGVLLFRPGKPLYNGSNPLIDRMGNQFRIIVSSQHTPDVICLIDPICGDSVIPKVRMVTKVDNPYIALNMNLTEEYVEEAPLPTVEPPPEGRRGGYIVFILGAIAIITPLALFLKIRMDQQMRDQLNAALEELERDLAELKRQINEKKKTI